MVLVKIVAEEVPLAERRGSGKVQELIAVDGDVERHPLPLFVVLEGAVVAGAKVSRIEGSVAEELHLAGRLVAVVELEGLEGLAVVEMRMDSVETESAVPQTPDLDRSLRDPKALALGVLVSWEVKMMSEGRYP